MLGVIGHSWFTKNHIFYISFAYCWFGLSRFVPYYNPSPQLCVFHYVSRTYRIKCRSRYTKWWVWLKIFCSFVFRWFPKLVLWWSGCPSPVLEQWKSTQSLFNKLSTTTVTNCLTSLSYLVVITTRTRFHLRSLHIPLSTIMSGVSLPSIGGIWVSGSGLCLKLAVA